MSSVTEANCELAAALRGRESRRLRRRDGTPWKMPAAEFRTVRDGKIVETRVFCWDLVKLRDLVIAA